MEPWCSAGTPRTTSLWGSSYGARHNLCGEECYATQADSLMISFILKLEKLIKT